MKGGKQAKIEEK